MFGEFTQGGRKYARLWSVLIAGTFSVLLVGCQTGAVDAVDAAPTEQVGVEIVPRPNDLRGVPADRIAEQLAARSAAQRESAERFQGVPADRVVEQLERESRE